MPARAGRSEHASHAQSKQETVSQARRPAHSVPPPARHPPTRTGMQTRSSAVIAFNDTERDLGRRRRRPAALTKQYEYDLHIGIPVRRVTSMFRVSHGHSRHSPHVNPLCSAPPPLPFPAAAFQHRCPRATLKTLGPAAARQVPSHAAVPTPPPLPPYPFVSPAGAMAQIIYPRPFDAAAAAALCFVCVCVYGMSAYGMYLPVPRACLCRVRVGCVSGACLSLCALSRC